MAAQDYTGHVRGMPARAGSAPASYNRDTGPGTWGAAGRCQVNRRDFLQLSLGTAIAAVPLQASAWMACGPFTINGGQYCYAGIRSQLRHVPAAVTDGRHPVPWSWAACAAMVCGYGGYRISQQRIVTETWGSIGSVPEASEEILADLEGRWLDEAGRPFHIQSEFLPHRPQAASAILRHDWPVLVVTAGQPMVVTTLRYISIDDARGDVQGIAVSDPRQAAGPTRLPVAAWYAADVLAAVHVERA